MAKKQWLGGLCGILTGVCWGISGVFSQYLYGATGMTSQWFVAVRLACSGLLMMLWVLWKKREELVALLQHRKHLARAIITGVLGTMLFQMTFYGTVAYSNAGTATIFQYLCPVLVMGYVCLRDRRIPKCVEIICMVMAVLGIFLISTHGNIHSLVLTPKALILGLACAFFMMLCTVLPEKLYEYYSTLTITAVSLLSGGVVAMLWVRPWTLEVHFQMISLTCLVLAIACGSVLAYVVYGVAIKIIGASKASLFSCSEIVCAAVLSVVFLHSAFGWWDLAGCVLIVATVFLNSVCLGQNKIALKH